MIASFVFFSSWLILRHYSVGPSVGSWGCLIKPVLVHICYIASIAINGVTFSGHINPWYAIELLIWGKSYYGYKSISTNDQTVWQANSYGRYGWIYIVAPLVGAIAAGIFAKFHVG